MAILTNEQYDKILNGMDKVKQDTIAKVKAEIKTIRIKNCVNDDFNDGTGLMCEDERLCCSCKSLSDLEKAVEGMK